MKFIKELITNKGWAGAGAHQRFDQEDLRRDLQEEGGFDSPLLSRGNQQALDLDDDEELWLNDAGEMADPGHQKTYPDTPEAAEEWDKKFLLNVSDAANADTSVDEMEDWDLDAEDDEPYRPEMPDEPEMALDHEDGDVEEWNLGIDGPEADPVAGDYQFSEAPTGEDENSFFEDPIFQDTESAAEIEQAAIEAVQTQNDLSTVEKEALLAEIRNAMDTARHVRSDEERGRQSAARDQLGRVEDAAQDDRILDETNEMMADDDGARRRQAIALMKAAAEATRSDPELKDLASRDMAMESEEQDEYRQDLESFDPPRLHTTRPRKKSEILDQMSPDEFVEQLDTAEPMAEVTSAPAAPAGELTDERLDEILSGMDFSEDKSSETAAEPSEPKRTDLRSALQAARNLRTVELADAAGAQKMDDASVPAKNIWELEGDIDEKPLNAEPEMPPAPVFQVPPPTQGRSGRQVGRVKTRLLGFQHEDEAEDPFEQDSATGSVTAGIFPVGWLVIVDGPGNGRAFALAAGVTQIGRGDDQGVRLDFGDLAISRQNHAAIAYDQEQNGFYLGHGGKSNLVRLNSGPVLSTEPLKNGDQIRIGETTLRFVALCGPEFSWVQKGRTHGEKTAFG
jgi:hypothetical protein